MVFKNIFYTLLPLLILLYFAIFTRILEYGITENRYYITLLAFWLTAISLYFIISKGKNIKYIPISLFLIGVLSLMMPYYNVFSTSIRSQKKELTTLLIKNKLLKDGKIQFDKPINENIADEISSKIDYLNDRNQAGVHLPTFARKHDSAQGTKNLEQ